MSVNYESELKSTRSAALSAANEIDKVIRRYSGKQQLQFSMTILHNICSAFNSTEVLHGDIYCDILENTILPHLVPDLNPNKWTRILEFVRYMHYQMINKKYFKEAERVVKIFKNQKDLLQNPTDYKILINIYCQHIFLQSARVQTEEGKSQVILALELLNTLFKHIKYTHVAQKFQYPDLLNDFLTALMPKRSSTAFNILSSVLATKETFAEFFKLLSTLNLQTKDVHKIAEMHMEALYTFMEFDMQNKLKLQLALQHLSLCNELFSSEIDTNISYFFALLKNFFKCIYQHKSTKNLSSIYAQLCEKFVSFLEKFSKQLMTQKWFLNALVILQALFTHIQQYPGTDVPFDQFWQELKHIDAYSAHLQFILCCIKLAPGISENKLVNWSCCTSTRKHVIIGFSTCVLGSYSAFLKYVNEKECKTLKVQELQHSLLTIVHHALQVMDTLACLTADSQSLKIFFARFLQLIRDVSTVTQAYFCINNLAQELLKIKQKLTSSDWLMLLRRLYKTAALTKDAKLIGELTSCHIGSMLLQQVEPDMNALFNQIGVYYNTNAENLHEKCLLKYFAACKHVLKPQLQPEQQRLIYWLEAQYISKYERNNLTLQASLLSCAQLKHDYMFLVCACKIYTEEVLKEVQNIVSSLNSRLRKNEKLSRLEYLVLAQATSALLISETDIEKRKKITNFTNIECKEQNLELLMEREEVNAISLQNELRIINLALAALKAYEIFYKQADQELIANDVAFIDWELIVDDLRYLALFLQYSGYHEHATHAWLLHYKVTGTIMDTFNQMRSFAYFCEHAELIENSLDLKQEIALMLQPLNNALQQLPSLSRRQQNAVLLAYCQLAYYYAREGNFNIAQILLDLVKKKQSELKESKDKYDIVLSTVDVVRFRIAWKFLGNQTERKPDHFVESCSMHNLSLILNRLRDFVIISSGDALAYLILIFNITQQAAEFTANRLCENLSVVYIPLGIKMALQTGSALRFIQILTAWMWSNLQAEHVKKAQIKLQIIECVMGIRNWQERVAENKKAVENAVSCLVNKVSLLNINCQVETIRRVGVQQHEIHATFNNEIQELPEFARHCDLKRFFSWKSEQNDSNTEMFKWIYFSVGCLNARLYYLIGDHDQLTDYYDSCQHWLQKQKNTHLAVSYQNIELLLLQHYANYLHATRKYENAKELLEVALKRYEETRKNVDLVYHINFILQLKNIQKAIQQKQKQQQCQALDKVAMNNLITPKPKELPFSIYTEEKQQVAVRKATKSKTTTKRMLYKTTPTHMSSNSSNSDTPDSISSLEELEDLNTCQIIELHTSSEKELAEDLNVCQIIDLDSSSEKVKTKKVVKKTKKKELSENNKKTITATKESRTLKQQLNVEETKLDSQTPKTRGRPRKINKLANDENIQPAAVQKPTILTRRRRLN